MCANSAADLDKRSRSAYHCLVTQTNAKARCTVGGGGWIRYKTPELRHPIYARLRLSQPDGRLEVCELHLGGGNDRMDAGDLRKVPFGAIVAAVNNDEVKTWVLRRINDDPVPWTAPVVQVPKGAKFLDMVNYRISGFEVPKSSPYPPEFYEQVARLYQGISQESVRPAVVLANATGVPVTTSRAWIKRAREKGYLPAGRKGARG